MILVDVYVPALGNTYDFKLDEEEKIGIIIEEISELVGQKEHSGIVGEIDDLMLCLREDQKILPRNMTLNEAGVLNGSSLILL